MKYLLLIYAQEAQWQAEGDEFDEQLVQKYIAVMDELKAEGVYLDGRRLLPTETATTIKVRNGETLVSDGPFAETKEQLGGFFLVDCTDLDHATKVAKMIPSAEFGSIEIRPLWYQDE